MGGGAEKTLLPSSALRLISQPWRAERARCPPPGLVSDVLFWCVRSARERLTRTNRLRIAAPGTPAKNGSPTSGERRADRGGTEPRAAHAPLKHARRPRERATTDDYVHSFCNTSSLGDWLHQFS